jgi:hypothetical protein
MCLDAVQHVIDNNLLAQFQIPVAFEEWIKRSWDRDELTILRPIRSRPTTAPASRSCWNTTPTPPPRCSRPRSSSGIG